MYIPVGTRQRDTYIVLQCRRKRLPLVQQWSVARTDGTSGLVWSEQTGHQDLCGQNRRDIRTCVVRTDGTAGLVWSEQTGHQDLCGQNRRDIRTCVVRTDGTSGLVWSGQTGQQNLCGQNRRDIRTCVVRTDGTSGLVWSLQLFVLAGFRGRQIVLVLLPVFLCDQSNPQVR